jgi:surface antigen
MATNKTFVIRTTKPGAGNKYYIRKANGGYSDAIEGYPKDANCNVLSNCVGYAYGRFNEIGGWGYCKYLAPVNAENFMQYKGSCKTGTTPKLGACMVWQDSGYGHVAIVEKVISNTEVLTSESAWGGSAFYTTTRKKGNGNWGYGGTFLGFIYNPAECCNVTTAPEPQKIAYTLVTDVDGYNSSDDAKAHTNAKTTVKKGTYYMFNPYPNGYNGMYNITTNPAVPGSWINPADNVVPVAKPKTFNVGDIVDFIGTKHYISANASIGSPCKPGKAKITKIYQLGKSKHPYHLIKVSGGNSTVYGWVNASDIK